MLNAIKIIPKYTALLPTKFYFIKQLKINFQKQKKGLKWNTNRIKLPPSIQGVTLKKPVYPTRIEIFHFIFYEIIFEESYKITENPLI